MKNKTPTMLAMTMLGILSTSLAFAHTTVLKKNTPDGWAERTELEGTSAVSATTISHGCSFNGSETQKVTAQSVLWPNGYYSTAVKKGTEEEVVLADHFIGNAVMRPRAVQDHNIFKKIEIKTGDVPIYNSHGEKYTDTRAFHYTKGELETYLYGVVPYSASYPKFKPESCATKLIIQFGIANYCNKSKSDNDNDRSDIWIGMLTDKFDDPDVVSVGFWPHVNVVRDMVKNPIADGACPGGTFEVVVTPGPEEIDEFMPVKGYWPSED